MDVNKRAERKRLKSLSRRKIYERIRNFNRDRFGHSRAKVSHKPLDLKIEKPKTVKVSLFERIKNMFRRAQ